MITDADIKKVVRRRKGGGISEWEIAKHRKGGAGTIAEVWFFQDGRYNTSFVLYTPNKIEKVFEDFAAFADIMVSADTIPVQRDDAVELFISHAHKDQDIAKDLVDALQIGFAVPNRAIRCTSVPGFELDPGNLPADALRHELRSASTVIGIITPNSLASEWVQFELGGAWGLIGRVLPLLGGGLSSNDLPGPLRGAAAIQLSDELKLGGLCGDTGARFFKWEPRNLDAGRARLHDLAAAVRRKTFVEDDVERDRRRSFSARRHRIGNSQNRILDFLGRRLLDGTYIKQSEIYDNFKDTQTDLYYRLEHLRLLGFLTRRQIGKRGGVPEYEWTLSNNYRVELSG
jgi:hypothetical protein